MMMIIIITIITTIVSLFHSVIVTMAAAIVHQSLLKQQATVDEAGSISNFDHWSHSRSNPSSSSQQKGLLADRKVIKSHGHLDLSYDVANSAVLVLLEWVFQEIKNLELGI